MPIDNKHWLNQPEVLVSPFQKWGYVLDNRKSSLIFFQNKNIHHQHRRLLLSPIHHPKAA